MSPTSRDAAKGRYSDLAADVRARRKAKEAAAALGSQLRNERNLL